jgi:hypothetical protein
MGLLRHLSKRGLATVSAEQRDPPRRIVQHVVDVATGRLSRLPSHSGLG